METGGRLEKYAYALIVDNGFQPLGRFPVLDAAWPMVAPALPFFFAGPQDRLQLVCARLPVFFNFTGRWDEWLSFEVQAEARALAMGDYLRAGQHACEEAYVRHLRRMPDELLACAERATTHWEQAKVGSEERATVLRLQGLGYHLKRDYPKAIEAFKQSIAILKSVSLASLDLATVSNDLADAQRGSGDFVAAERGYREALRLAHTLRHAEGVAAFLGNLAGLALDRKDWPKAESLAREALPFSELVGRQELIANSCYRLAFALVRQGKKEEALSFAKRAVEIFTKVSWPNLQDVISILHECEK
jgi:tetratricopeptide (TPR) repeat protein